MDGARSSSNVDRSVCTNKASDVSLRGFERWSKEEGCLPWQGLCLYGASDSK